MQFKRRKKNYSKGVLNQNKTIINTTAVKQGMGEEIRYNVIKKKRNTYSKGVLSQNKKITNTTAVVWERIKDIIQFKRREKNI